MERQSNAEFCHLNVLLQSALCVISLSSSIYQTLQVILGFASSCIIILSPESTNLMQ
jgi:hypothetical protein